MSIDVGALVRDWEALLVHVPVVLAVKGAVLIGLVLALGIAPSGAIRTGFYLSQVGEFAFVLLGAAAVAGLLSAGGAETFASVNRRIHLVNLSRIPDYDSIYIDHLRLRPI